MGSFDKRAKEWDLKDRRVKSAKDIAYNIKKNISLNKSMTIVDIGVGTGLLGEFLSNEVAKIIGVDNSKEMLKEFLRKRDKFNCEIEALIVDLNKDKLNIRSNGIISSMTLHHIKDTKRFFQNLYEILETNSFIAIADLLKEDGTFHSDNKGVYHFGFEKDKLIDILKKIGFKDINFDIISTIKKPHKEFELFLLTAKR